MASMTMAVAAAPPTTAIPPHRKTSAASLNLRSSQSEATISIPLSYSSSSLSLSSTSSPSPLPFVHCGRGDKKTARGKRFNHSFGNARPRDKKSGRGPPRIPVPAAPVAPNLKDELEDDEVVKIDIDESLFSG